MKKSIKVIIFSCLVGAILATVFFLNIKDKVEAKNKNIASVYQVGVFKNKNNAINLKKQYNAIKIIKDNDYYRVLIGVTISNQEEINKIFANMEYNYFLKEIEVDNNTIENIKKYDELLKNSQDENKLLIIERMLESLPDEL